MADAPRKANRQKNTVLISAHGEAALEPAPTNETGSHSYDPTDKGLLCTIVLCNSSPWTEI
jgi:hypothetical protein